MLWRPAHHLTLNRNQPCLLKLVSTKTHIHLSIWVFLISHSKVHNAELRVKTFNHELLIHQFKDNFSRETLPSLHSFTYCKLPSKHWNRARDHGCRLILRSRILIDLVYIPICVDELQLKTIFNECRICYSFFDKLFHSYFIHDEIQARGSVNMVVHDLVMKWNSAGN